MRSKSDKITTPIYLKSHQTNQVFLYYKEHFGLEWRWRTESGDEEGCIEPCSEELWILELSRFIDGVSILISPLFSDLYKDHKFVGGMSRLEFETAEDAIAEVGCLIDKIAPNQKEAVLLQLRGFENDELEKGD